MTDFSPPFKPETLVGEEGDNIFFIINNCRSLAKELEWPSAWIDEFTKEVMGQQSYSGALVIVKKYFTLEENDESR